MTAKRGRHIPGAAADALPRKSVPAVTKALAAVLRLPTDGKLTVRWTRFDYDGPFCLAASSIDTVVTMFKAVSHLESMTPAEVFGGGVGKDYGDPAGLPNQAAVRRLRELSLQDETNISRLSFMGRQRLYGFRRDLEFYAIFWDPDHQIWPSVKRHT